MSLTSAPAPPGRAQDGRAPGAPRRVEVVVSSATVVKALALALGILLVVIARDAVLSVLLATLLVLGLDPPVTRLERRGIGRGKAALLVFGAIAAAVFVIVVWAVAPVWSELRQFVGDLPRYVDELRDAPALRELDQNTEALAKLQAAFADAAATLPQAAIGLLGAAGALFSGVLTLATLVFLTLFGLIAKPALTRSALELLPPHTAARVGTTVDEVSRTISAALVGNVVISVIAGVVVGVAAALAGAPSPVVLAVIVGLFDLIPQVGSAIAAVIVTLVTLVATGPVAAAVMLAVILVYQQIENYAIQPAVMRQAVEISPFATIAAVLAGSALLGVVGAILAVPVAASVKVVAVSATADRRARMAALRGGGPPSLSSPRSPS